MWAEEVTEVSGMLEPSLYWTHTPNPLVAVSTAALCVSLSLSLPWHILRVPHGKPWILADSRTRTKHCECSPFLHTSLCGSNVSCRGFRTVRPLSLSVSAPDHMFIGLFSKSQQAIVPAGLILNHLAQYEEKETFPSGQKHHVQLCSSCPFPCLSLMAHLTNVFCSCCLWLPWSWTIEAISCLCTNTDSSTLSGVHLFILIF